MAETPSCLWTLTASQRTHLEAAGGAEEEGQARGVYCPAGELPPQSFLPFREGAGVPSRGTGRVPKTHTRQGRVGFTSSSSQGLRAALLALEGPVWTDREEDRRKAQGEQQ